jgi:hypothetical protein
MSKGATPMNAIPEKKKLKRPSKGMRKHNRKVKQEARKANLPAKK